MDKKLSELTDQELSKLTDQELLDEASKMKLSPVINAFFIGFLVSITFYSIIQNSWGLLTFIPLYFAYKLIKDSKNNKALEKLLKERNLK